MDEAGDAGGRAPQFAEESPGPESGDDLFDEGPDLRVGPVDRLLACGEVLPSFPVRGAAGASVSLVGSARDVCLDDAVFADVVDGAGQGW